MPEHVCGNCRHWFKDEFDGGTTVDEWSEAVLCKHPRLNACEINEDSGWATRGIWTLASFGCIQWEARD